MNRGKSQMLSGEDLFVGIDIHKNRWHITIRTFDVEVFSASIPGTWEALPARLGSLCRTSIAGGL